MSNKLPADPLFIGLTRPSLIFGVSMPFAMLNMMISIVAYIQTSSLLVIFVSAFVHLIGYIICFKEPLFLELYLNKASKCKTCYNKSYYGANSYYV